MKVVTALATAVCLSCLLTGTGCDKSGGADYWPMAEGNLWQYRYVAVTAQPDSTPDTLTYSDYMTWKCGSQVTFGDGSKAWAMDFDNGDTVYFSEEGNAVLWYDGISQADPDTWLVLPLEEGRTWHYAGGTMTVREKGTVDVPSGTFKNCWKVEILGDADQSGTFLWFAPNVGMVLMEQSDESQGYTYSVRIELTSKVVK